MHNCCSSLAVFLILLQYSFVFFVAIFICFLQYFLVFKRFSQPGASLTLFWHSNLWDTARDNKALAKKKTAKSNKKKTKKETIMLLQSQCSYWSGMKGTRVCGGQGWAAIHQRLPHSARLALWPMGNTHTKSTCNDVHGRATAKLLGLLAAKVNNKQK